MTTTRLLSALVFGLVVGCGGDKDASDDSGSTSTTDGTTDGTTDSGGPVDPLCVDAPVVTWDSWGQGFLRANCQSCHSTTSNDRRGAPDDIFFDDRDAALAHAERILARSAGLEPTMPPSGGVDENDRYKLEVWLTCWE